jgi:hypothetical protein
MTKFHLGLLAGLFLGGLVTLVALGIIQLYKEKRQEKSALPREKAAREIQDTIGALSYDNHTPQSHLPFPTLQEPDPEGETTVCYLSILIE